MHEWRASRHWLGQKITPEYTCCPVMSAYDLSFVRGRSYQTLLTQLLFLKCNWCMRTNHLITIFFLVGWTRRKKRRNRLAHWDDGPNKNRFSCCRFSIIIYFAGFFFRLVKKLQIESSREENELWLYFASFFQDYTICFFQCSRWLCSTTLVIFVHEHHNIILENRSEDWNTFSVGYKSNLVLPWSDRKEKCRKKFFSLHALHTAFLGITCSWKKIIKWNGTTLK